MRAYLGFTVPDAPKPPRPGERWELTGANGSCGHAWVYLAPGRSRLEHPIIVAEGFPGGYPCDELYKLIDQHGTVERLQAAGYDLVLLGYARGIDRIENNAQVAIACIQEAMRRTANPLVVGGLSMGGLVIRYALAQMEARGEDHNTRIYLSIDAPHRGAHTSLAAQWFVHYFSTASTAAAEFVAALDSPANQEFVMSWLHAGCWQESPLRRSFLEALESLGGYPQRPRRIAIASGRGDGLRAFPPSQPAMTWLGYPFAWARLWTLPEGDREALVAHGHWHRTDGRTPAEMRVRSEVSWDAAPGGQNLYHSLVWQIADSLGCGQLENLIPVSCAVPTVSALDLGTDPFTAVPPPETGASPFEAYAFCEENLPHLHFTQSVSRWLLQQLGTPVASSGR